MKLDILKIKQTNLILNNEHKEKISLLFHKKSKNETICLFLDIKANPIFK